MEEEFVSPGDAAKLLGISRQRLTQLREKGQVRAHRVGHFWLYHRGDLERRRSEMMHRETEPQGREMPANKYRPALIAA
jgi:excisionase family DNA binding protein